MHADDDHRASIPKAIDDRLRNGAAFAADADEHGVHTRAIGPVTHRVFDAGGDDALSAHRRGDRESAFVQIGGHHACSSALQQTRREQSDQSLADDEHALAQSHARLPHAFHRDRCQRRVSGLPVLDAIGNLRREQIRHAEHLRMVRALRAATCDAISDAESRIRLIHRDDHARRRVTQRRRRLETVAHFFQRGLPTECACRIEHLAHLIGSGAGFFEQGHARLIDLHLLRPRRDDGASRAHENPAGRRHRNGHVLQFKASVLVLSELFHGGRSGGQRAESFGFVLVLVLLLVLGHGVDDGLLEMEELKTENGGREKGCGAL